MKPSPITRELQGLTDRLIAYRFVRRITEQDSTMSKILEAARLVAERKKAYDERAQAIIDGMEGLDSKANQAFERPEGIMANTEQEFKDLHTVFDAALLVSNSEKNDEGNKETAASQVSFNSSPANDSAPGAPTQEHEKPMSSAAPVTHESPLTTTRPVLQGAPFAHQ